MPYSVRGETSLAFVSIGTDDFLGKILDSNISKTESSGYSNRNEVP